MNLTSKNSAVILLIIACFFSCTKEKTIPPSPSQVQLHWNKSHSDDSFTDALTGLEWIFSYVGAKKTEKIYEMPQSENSILLDVSLLGFSEENILKLRKLHQQLIISEEYEVSGEIDMGRYSHLLFGASIHYYDLVDMPLKLNDLLSDYTLQNDSGYVNNSLITDKHRKLRYSNQIGLNQLWLVAELDENTGEVTEFETIDFQENGQPRFGIYDENGFLKNSSEPDQTVAGKPAKCMWCHESLVQPLFSAQEDFANYLTYNQLSDTLSFYRESIEAEQLNLIEGVDYSKKQDHLFAELLYVSFEEPSLMRLSLEWGISESDLVTILVGIPTHVNAIYPQMGQVYFRRDIEQFAPYSGLKTSDFAREKSSIHEVSYFH